MVVLLVVIMYGCACGDYVWLWCRLCMDEVLVVIIYGYAGGDFVRLWC
jgi:hypothetical protein